MLRSFASLENLRASDRSSWRLWRRCSGRKKRRHSLFGRRVAPDGVDLSDFASDDVCGGGTPSARWHRALTSIWGKPRAERGACLLALSLPLCAACQSHRGIWSKPVVRVDWQVENILFLSNIFPNKFCVTSVHYTCLAYAEIAVQTPAAHRQPIMNSATPQ